MWLGLAAGIAAATWTLRQGRRPAKAPGGALGHLAAQPPHAAPPPAAAEPAADSRLAAQRVAHAEDRVRRIRRHPSTDPAAAVERLFYLSSQRSVRVGHQEHPQNTYPSANNQGLQALGDPASSLSQALLQAGCAAWFEARGDTLVVRADAPLAREVGRRLVAKLQSKQQMRPETAVRLLGHLQRDLEHEVVRAGRAAMHTLRIKRLHPEMVRLVGSLTFRLSYSQNQWKHALEAAELAGLLAAELGLNARDARRAGLLHDIGKALTHEREGAHAVLGAEVARRCGEREAIANAIGAHHHDEPPQGPLAYLVATADALSGARPGARREPVDAYLQRLTAIENIVRVYPEVKNVDIMRAGREIRVHLPGRQEHEAAPPDGDAMLAQLARSMAQDIRHGVALPGEIRVTVVRTTRATCTVSRHEQIA